YLPIRSSQSPVFSAVYTAVGFALTAKAAALARDLGRKSRAFSGQIEPFDRDDLALWPGARAVANASGSGNNVKTLTAVKLFCLIGRPSYNMDRNATGARGAANLVRPQAAARHWRRRNRLGEEKQWPS
ncbi:MAG: hypothetical protein V3R63_00110, partial [Alphaproteobacteria bacterium]